MTRYRYRLALAPKLCGRLRHLVDKRQQYECR